MSASSPPPGPENGKSTKEREEKGPKPPNRLVLCFDGTGNKFSGTSSDTNIVKLYQLCDRTTKGQFHYYQPGIGTYSTNERSHNSGYFGKIKRWMSQTIDQGFGTTFDHHVTAGYKFVMRYYKPGDKIFIFGFSRGAFTARFLARLITEIGLLSKGNEEMVPFAYRTYYDFETGGGGFESAEEGQEFMDKFKDTFCRMQVGIHFLGLFDTVNSVGYFELPFARKTYMPTYAPAASFIRHAVSVDERRLKFRPALFHHDAEHVDPTSTSPSEIKEVWFPGNHGDIGGGWEPADTDREMQLSDIALEWMIGEIQNLPDPPEEKIKFNQNLDRFQNRLSEAREHAVTQSMCHDALSFKKGRNWLKVIFWWILEILPIFKRLELVGGKWVSRYFPPNMGDTRDIPPNATLHPSVLHRHRENATYRPTNQGFQDALTHNLQGE